MADLTVEELEVKLALWRAAEDACAAGESYQIGKLQLTRQKLPMIRQMIAFYESEILRTESGRRSGARQMRFVPRDL